MEHNQVGRVCYTFGGNRYSNTDGVPIYHQHAIDTVPAPFAYQNDSLRINVTKCDRIASCVAVQNANAASRDEKCDTTLYVRCAQSEWAYSAVHHLGRNNTYSCRGNSQQLLRRCRDLHTERRKSTVPFGIRVVAQPMPLYAA